MGYCRLDFLPWRFGVGFAMVVMKDVAIITDKTWQSSLDAA